MAGKYDNFDYAGNEDFDEQGAIKSFDVISKTGDVQTISTSGGKNKDIYETLKERADREEEEKNAAQEENQAAFGAGFDTAVAAQQDVGAINPAASLAPVAPMPEVPVQDPATVAPPIYDPNLDVPQEQALDPNAAGGAIVADPRASGTQEIDPNTGLPVLIQSTSSGSTTRDRTVFDPDAEKLRKDTKEAQIRAQEFANLSLVAQQQILADTKVAQATEVRSLLKENEAKEQDRQLAIADEGQKLRDIIAEAGDMKVNPDNYYGEGVTPRRIGALIAIALGGLGAAMQGPGVKNTALELINQNIDRDIAAQKANIGIKQNQVGNQNNIYGRVLQQSGDERLADAAARKAMYDAHIADIEAKVAMSKIPSVKANGAAMIAGLRAQSAESDAVILRQTEKKVDSQVDVKKIPTPEVTPKGEVAVLKDLNAKGAALNRMRDLKAVYEDETKLKNLKVGPISGRVSDALRSIGVEWIPETSETLTQQNAVLALFVKAMSGAQVTDKEREWYERMLPTAKDNPELALSKLREMERQLSGDFKDTYEDYRSGGQVTPNMEKRFGGMLDGSSGVSSFQEQ